MIMVLIYLFAVIKNEYLLYLNRTVTGIFQVNFDFYFENLFFLFFGLVFFNFSLLWQFTSLFGVINSARKIARME